MTHFRMLRRLLVLLAMITAPATAQGPIGFTPSLCDPGNPNSTGASGAIAATGSEDIGDQDVTLIASNIPPGQFGYFVGSRTLGFIPLPPGSVGNVCVLGLQGRYAEPGQIGVGPTLTLDVGSIPVPTFPAPGEAIVAGEIWYWQAWHRDLGGSNFTNAVGIEFNAGGGCPSNPQALASVPVAGEAYAVAVLRNGARIITRSNRSGPDAIQFIDARTGSLVSAFDASSGASGMRTIVTTPSRAVIAGDAGPDAVQIFELEGAPSRIASHALTSDAYDIAIDGNNVVVRAGAGPDAVTFYDASSGVRTSTTASTSAPSGVRAVAIDGASAVVTGSGPNFVQIYRGHLGSWALSGWYLLSSAPYDVDGAGLRYVVRASGSGNDAVSAVVGVSPFPTRFFAAASAASGARAVVVEGTRAIVTGAAGPDAVQVIETNGLPDRLATYALTADAQDVVAPFGTAVVRTGPAASDATTFYDLVTAERIGRFASTESTNGQGVVCVQLNRVLVAAGSSAQLFEVPTTGPPVLVSTMPLGASSVDIAAFGGLSPSFGCRGAVVRTSAGADVIDMASGQVTGSFVLSAPATGPLAVAAVGDRAVLATAGSVEVLDLAR